MTEKRERVVAEAATAVLLQSNYDPHFSGIEAWRIVETQLFLARYDALREYESMNIPRLEPGRDIPIPMILFCPACRCQHIDAEEPHKPSCRINDSTGQPWCDCGQWTNPPHISHLCKFCGHIWRPADVPTTGVADITTRGEKDNHPLRGVASIVQQWRDKRGSYYVEVARGKFVCRDPGGIAMLSGDQLIAYQGYDGRFWFRLETEFMEGPFEKVED